MDENRLFDVVQAFLQAMSEKATVDATYGVMYSGDLVVFSFGNERYIVPPEQVRDMRATVDGGRDIARNLIRRYMANNKPAECPECDVFSGTATVQPAIDIKPSCGVCRFWKKNEWCADGWCRRDPPRLLSFRSSVRPECGIWPSTMEYDWCGEFQAK